MPVQVRVHPSVHSRQGQARHGIQTKALKYVRINNAEQQRHTGFFG